MPPSLPVEMGKDNKTINYLFKDWEEKPKGQQMIRYKGTSDEVKQNPYVCVHSPTV